MFQILLLFSINLVKLRIRREEKGREKWKFWFVLWNKERLNDKWRGMLELDYYSLDTH
jgi:hypothetical protein